MRGRVGLRDPGCSCRSRRTWRGEHTFFEEKTRLWWFWGDWSWQGLIRAAPTIVVGFAVACFCLPFMMAFPAQSTGQIVAVAIGLGGFGLAWMLAASIAVFGRPRTLIPPHRRRRQPKRQGVVER